MGDEAAATLSAFGERCGQRLATEITRQLRLASVAQVTYADEVRLATLSKARPTNKRPVAGHADGLKGFAVAAATDGVVTSQVHRANYAMNQLNLKLNAVTSADESGEYVISVVAAPEW